MIDKDYYSEFDLRAECEENLVANEENFLTYSTFSWWTCGLLVLLICCYGILANAIAAQMLICRPNLATSRVVKVYLLFQVLFDCLYLFCNFCEGIEQLKASNTNTMMDAALVYKVKTIIFYCSIGIRIILIREKYISTISEVRLPHSHIKNFLFNPIVYVIMLIVFSLILSIPLFYEMKEVNIENHFGDYFNTTLDENVKEFESDHIKDLYDDNHADNTETIPEPATGSTSKNFEATLTLILPTELRFSYHYIFWYKIIIVTCLPSILIVVYCLKTRKAITIRIKNESLRAVEMCLNSLATESYVNRLDSKYFAETIGVIVMCMMFILIGILKSILLVYEVINIQWIEEHYTMCMVPHVLFYGKTAIDLLCIINASVSTYLYFLCKYHCNSINSWLIKDT